MISFYSRLPVYLLLRRGLNTASAWIQPPLADKHRDTITSCCAIEVTTDRLSYASLCLDPENKNSVILSSWNSLSLNLPSGKEFRPSMCSSVAYNCTNIIKDNILSSNSLGANTDIILRPITLSSTTTHNLDIRTIHQAVIMGYLLAYLSSNINNNTSKSQLYMSTNCPSLETLTKWTNQSTSHWATYLNEQLFKNQSDIIFSLLPVKSNRVIKASSSMSTSTKTIHNTTSTNSNINNNSSEIIQMLVHSSQLLSIYKCSNSKNHKHTSTVQFLLARCLFTCLIISVKLQLYIVNLHPTSIVNENIIRHKTKRWAYYEIHKCGRIKGYSCLEHRHCYERYLRHDMVCFEVYPCLSSCIFIAQLHDAEKLNEQIKKLLLDGVPVNDHNDPINYVREQTAKLSKELNLTLSSSSSSSSSYDTSKISTPSASASLSEVSSWK
ncbi:unnamed protein product [Schistosoma turkestanicum]|nr:unnamed protein product [Schistosoma turkestanicum]